MSPIRVAACGVTNQRETLVVWERQTGRPVHPAIVWQDTRTAELVCELAGPQKRTDRYTQRTGLPLATYFTGPKLRWLLDHVDEVRDLALRGEVLAGTIDTWLLWNLTGGPNGGVHVTDVTNASRTLLMDIHSLQWDHEICRDLGVPLGMLPEIRPSSGLFGTGHPEGPLPGVSITGVLGDQNAALFGQACFHVGDVKNTYGTGNFLLLTTGARPVHSKHGLLTTVAYQLTDEPAVYALEGSVAVTGSLVQWLRDNLGIISSSDEVEKLASTVPDNGGCYVVPAFSGLFAPHWRPDARGVIVGLTRHTDRGHLGRACLEATAFQCAEVVQAMKGDASVKLTELRVDGGMVVNDLLMQMQADVLGVPVVRPVMTETTAVGAAYVAGLSIDLWDSPAELANAWSEDRRWEPRTSAAERGSMLANWHKAVTKSLDWVESS